MEISGLHSQLTEQKSLGTTLKNQSFKKFSVDSNPQLDLKNPTLSGEGRGCRILCSPYDWPLSLP